MVMDRQLKRDGCQNITLHFPLDVASVTIWSNKRQTTGQLLISLVARQNDWSTVCVSDSTCICVCPHVWSFNLTISRSFVGQCHRSKLKGHRWEKHSQEQNILWHWVVYTPYYNSKGACLTAHWSLSQTFSSVCHPHVVCHPLVICHPHVVSTKLDDAETSSEGLMIWLPLTDNCQSAHALTNWTNAVNSVHKQARNCYTMT